MYSKSVLKYSVEKMDFSINGSGLTGISYRKFGPNFTSDTKINSRWIIELNVEVK